MRAVYSAGSVRRDEASSPDFIRHRCASIDHNDLKYRASGRSQNPDAS